MEDFLSYLTQIDEQAFLVLNSWHTDFLDPVMWWLSNRLIWIPMYVLIGCWILKKYPWPKGVALILAIVLAVALTDFINASIIRPLVERLRPSNPDNPISAFVNTVNNYQGGKFGFPSCHASNSFALAIILVFIFKSWWSKALILLWAFLHSYSRIYLGVHYPGDILAGATFGIAMGLGMFFIWRKVTASYRFNNLFPSRQTLFSLLHTPGRKQ